MPAVRREQAALRTRPRQPPGPHAAAGIAAVPAGGVLRISRIENGATDRAGGLDIDGRDPVIVAIGEKRAIVVDPAAPGAARERDIVDRRESAARPVPDLLSPVNRRHRSPLSPYRTLRRIGDATAAIRRSPRPGSARPIDA